MSDDSCIDLTLILMIAIDVLSRVETNLGAGIQACEGLVVECIDFHRCVVL